MKRKLLRVGASFERVRVPGGKIYSQCMTEIQEKTILVRVSAMIQSARVRVIGSLEQMTGNKEKTVSNVFLFVQCTF